MRWTPERVAELAQLLELHSYAGAAGVMSERYKTTVTYNAVRNVARNNNITSSVMHDIGDGPPGVVRFDTFWKLSGDWALVGDLHCPHTDWELAGQVGAEAKRAGIRQLLICGDVFDLPALGRYAAVVPQQQALAEEKAGSYALRMWERVFDSIRVLTGNHDLRLFHALSGALGEGAVTAALLARLGADARTEWSVFGYCVIESETGEWRVTHPASYSRNALSVARRLAAKYLQHIVTFHEHHSALGFDDSGKFVIANIGCLADPDKLAYVRLADRASTPEMSRSFGLLKDGKLRLVTKHAAAW